MTTSDACLPESGLDDRAASLGDPFRTLLAVSAAIVARSDPLDLFRDLASALRHIVRFDYLALLLHQPASSTLGLHVLEPDEPDFPRLLGRLDDVPAGFVCQTQRPLVIGSIAELERWPQVAEWVRPYGINSLCELPLTTARRPLGTLAFASRQPAAFAELDLATLQAVANQVAVAVENTLAFREIEAISDGLAGENASIREEVCTAHDFREVVGESPSLLNALNHVATVAPTDASVLLLGETGTGKELMARALHDLSRRRDRAFIKLNCAAIPTGLLESELFGHERGAFTGAVRQKVGRFELAHQGTLFLDEVGDIPLELQPKFLRVLQEQEFERLGGARTIKVDVRLVAATHRDLARMVADGRFREDLYYRLHVFPVMLPPLRERPDDIPRLVRHFTAQFALRVGRNIESISSATMNQLVCYPWPGNVRELQNVIERAVILSPGRSLQIPSDDLFSTIDRPSSQCLSPPASALTLADAEREHILRTLRATGWVLGGTSGAAARLGLKRSTLYKRMKKLGISRTE